MRHPPPGTSLARPIGRGTVFEVSLVRDADGTALIAKRAAPTMRGRPEGSLALDREREILALLGGRSLPVLVRAGVDEAGPYLLETVAPGMRARELAAGGPLDASSWLTAARSAMRAFADLQQATDARGPLDFVHGDISPDNLIFGPGGEVTLVDLSNATLRPAPTPVFPNARGTLPYVAPEIARSERRPDPAGDVYALAATLLALAVGPITEAHTEAGRLHEVATRGLLVERFDRRPDLPQSARAAIHSALHFDREERTQGAAELWRRLCVLEGSP